MKYYDTFISELCVHSTLTTTSVSFLYLFYFFNRLRISYENYNNLEILPEWMSEFCQCLGKITSKVTWDIQFTPSVAVNYMHVLLLP